MGRGMRMLGTVGYSHKHAPPGHSSLLLSSLIHNLIRHLPVSQPPVTDHNSRSRRLRPAPIVNRKSKIINSFPPLNPQLSPQHHGLLASARISATTAASQSPATCAQRPETSNLKPETLFQPLTHG